MGILRRRSRDPFQSEREDRDAADARVVSKAFRFLQPLTIAVRLREPKIMKRVLASLLVIVVAAFPATAQSPAKGAVSVDLLITGATVVTMDPDRRVIE